MSVPQNGRGGGGGRVHPHLPGSSIEPKAGGIVSYGVVVIVFAANKIPKKGIKPPSTLKCVIPTTPP